jgi:hypothetical protein
MPKALPAGLARADIDVWEIHEAYASVGHPFGSSGTRYLLTLATELRRRGSRYGVAGLCVGSGQGVASVLENPRAS